MSNSWFVATVAPCGFGCEREVAASLRTTVRMHRACRAAIVAAGRFSIPACATGSLARRPARKAPPHTAALIAPLFVPRRALIRPHRARRLRDTERMKHSLLLKTLVVAGLALLLTLPVQMIQNLVAERQSRANETIAGIAEGWGKRQTVAGPYLIIPYERRWTMVRKSTVDGKQ